MNEKSEFDILQVTKNVSDMTSQEAAWYFLRKPICLKLQQ